MVNYKKIMANMDLDYYHMHFLEGYIHDLQNGLHNPYWSEVTWYQDRYFHDYIDTKIDTMYRYNLCPFTRYEINPNFKDIEERFNIDLVSYQLNGRQLMHLFSEIKDIFNTKYHFSDHSDNHTNLFLFMQDTFRPQDLSIIKQRISQLPSMKSIILDGDFCIPFCLAGISPLYIGVNKYYFEHTNPTLFNQIKHSIQLPLDGQEEFEKVKIYCKNLIEIRQILFRYKIKLIASDGMINRPESLKSIKKNGE